MTEVRNQEAQAAVDRYRAKDLDADIFIVSARFGAVGEGDAIPWYEAIVPAGTKSADWRQAGRQPKRRVSLGVYLPPRRWPAINTRLAWCGRF